MLRLPLLLVLPILLTGATKSSTADITALLECRQTRSAAETVRKGMKELTHSGDDISNSEITYDVAKARPFGTSKPSLKLTQYENQFGALELYRVVLNGKFEAVKQRMFEAHGASACTKSAAQSCTIDVGEATAELTLEKNGELAFYCTYED